MRSAALVAAVAIAFADSAIVVLALPDLLGQYDVSITTVAWVVTAYNVALALGALALVPLGRRFDAARLTLAGGLAFVAASLLCAVAPGVGWLIAFRAAQGVAAAALLVGALPVMRSLAPSRGVALWAGAGVFGAALGPALGGTLTEVFSWRAIFYAQAPVAAFGVLALVGLRVAPVFERGPRPRLASLALGLVSAALVGLLFLAVVQLIDVWRLSPLRAAAVVSVIPLATLAVAPVAARAGLAAVAPGALLLAGGLAGMAFLPASRIAWIVAALSIAGVGFGLALPALTRTAPGATAVWIRHAGLVVGLIVITPLLTTDLSAAGRNAELRGISTVLDAPVSASAKLRLAVELAPVLARPARKELPDFTKAVAPAHDAALTATGRSLDRVVQATVTRSFRGSFLVAAAFALCAAVLAVRRFRAPTVAALAGVVLLATELASGALTYGTRPKLLPPCAHRDTPQSVVLETLDAIACRVHKSREQLVADVARAGVDGAEYVKRIEQLATVISR